LEGFGKLSLTTEFDVTLSLPARVPPAKPMATHGRTAMAGGSKGDKFDADQSMRESKQ